MSLPFSETQSRAFLVAGAGAAGLSAALALAQAGFSVVCVGHVDTRPNGRTVALFEASLRFYKASASGHIFAARPRPFVRSPCWTPPMRGFPVPSLTFAASEIGLAAFGENIENNVLVEGLAHIASASPNLLLREGMIDDINFEADAVHASLADGSRISARLAVAADGRKSLLRTKAGIGTRTWTYPQIAFTALLAHAKPHRNISTEFHTRSGPCTLVPLHPDGGQATTARASCGSCPPRRRSDGVPSPNLPLNKRSKTQWIRSWVRSRSTGPPASSLWRG